MLPYLCRVAFFYMAKKKYSKKTLAAARDYGKLLGWKRLSPKRVRNFLDSVKELTGHVNIQNIVKVSKGSKEYSDSENIRYVEAARRWAQINRPTWNRIEKEELKEFKSEFERFANENKIFINSSNALDFADSFLTPQEIFEVETEFEDERTYLVRSLAGFNESDIVDSFLKMPTFYDAKIIDVDGRIVYLGSDRTAFWDSFRELTINNSFPIYDAYYTTNNDGTNRIVIEVTSYFKS